jgi:hypothetical protein
MESGVLSPLTEKFCYDIVYKILYGLAYTVARRGIDE